MSNIVLNEHDWARDMIERRSLGKKPTETLSRVARYYIDKKYNQRDVRSMLDTFVLQCDPSASLPKWDRLLDFAVNKATKTQAVMIDKIIITKPEIERIDALTVCRSDVWRSRFSCSRNIGTSHQAQRRFG